MKHYYKLIDPMRIGAPVVTYWHGDPAKAKVLITLRGFVLPLGTHKPKNVSRETLYEF